MKLINKIIVSFMTIGSLLLTGTACTAQSKQQDTRQQNVTKAPVENLLHIDADYMRDHIYDFEQHPNEFVYKGELPAIIDFYADWCRPCRSLSPKLSEVAKKYQGQLMVYKINVDDNPQLAHIFGVQSIPMVLFVPTNGEKPYQNLGDLPMDHIEGLLGEIGVNTSNQ